MTEPAVTVWDLPTRLFHWALVAVVIVQLVSGKMGWLSIHLLVGPAVLALLLFRLGWGLVGSETARFRQFVVGSGRVLAYLRGGPWSGLGHNPAGGWSVLVLLGVTLAHGVIGLFTSDDIVTDGPLVPLVSSATVKLAGKVHRGGVKLLLVVIAVHVAAVLYYKLVRRQDLIRPMITGEKPGQGLPPQLADNWRAVALLGFSAALVWGGLALVEG